MITCILDLKNSFNDLTFVDGSGIKHGAFENHGGLCPYLYICGVVART
jgi:hypothetical protein